MFLRVPEVGGDSESVDTHAQGARRKCIELLPVGAVFINGLHSGRGNDARSNAAQSMQLLRLAVWGVDGSELTVGVTQENEEVAGGALLHLLERKWTVRTLKYSQPWRKLNSDAPLQSCFSGIR